MPYRVKWNNFLIKVWWITGESASVMKEMMVKKIVQVYPAEEPPGISEIFFLMTEPTK